MTSSSDNPAADAASASSLAPDERRKHLRVALSLKARVLRAAGGEEPCLVINISAGGALLKAKNPPDVGEDVVLYIDEVGRFEGHVIRASKHAFAVDYRTRRAKSRRTADSLTYVLNAGGRRLDRRASPRIRHDAPATVTLESGERIACAILDISLTGASIEIEPRPALGAHISVGKMAAKVVRRHEKGVGVVFTGPAARMDDVISQASDPTPASGADVARGFGKKGLDT